MLPVIIAGAGPVGLALALALAGHDVPSVVLDDAESAPPARLARACVLPADLGHWARLLGDVAPEWTAWRTVHRGRTVLRHEFAPGAGPRQVPQHVLERALREAAGRQSLIRFAPGHRLTRLEQDEAGVAAYSAPRAPGGRRGLERQWRGSHLVGCDGPRSTVRKLLNIAFPGRTGVERFAVAALRAELPAPGEAELHRGLPGGEVIRRPLDEDRWRLDWPLTADGGLVTPDALLDRVHAALAAWHGGDIPPYELLDTGVHICHQRLAHSWRAGRVFLAGDAAHLLGALGTQQVAEGLRDVDNLAWKLAVACHQGNAEALLDSYQAERRPAAGRRLRAVDQALPLVRGGGLSARVRGRSGGRLALLSDSHLGRGALGGPARYGVTPIACAVRGTTATATPAGAPAEDVPVYTLEGERARLRERLGGPVLLVLTAPGARVWEARHWLGAGLMPELAATAASLPLPAELLVTEEYPGAGAHTLLVVRPDGYLGAALPGTAREALLACVNALRGQAAHHGRPEPAADR
ncbi:FAD-dependent monooxygenase [Streptomyces sp. DSM 44917]|uniref:FAD-dependent monooxygenase n=1 Tax=Streptomyces boetiae TaxID=3075541 RepID=A0ABU2L222_9ACTN|nr:FAD-dependent monooxygenase [Streptomyces sp. DSM 44917]MDT0305604.1 FAD-dependent monooxygenase [Streptomyces sp. DSM 44917]